MHLMKVEVGQWSSFAQLVVQGSYAHVSPEVTERNFPLDPAERVTRYLKLQDCAALGPQASTVAVEALLLEKRLRPATVSETLFWGYQHPPLVPVPPEGYLHAVSLGARNARPDKDGYSVLTVATYGGSALGQTLTTRRHSGLTWQTSRYLFLCVAL